MHSRMVRTAEAMRFSQAARSSGVALRREMVDLAGEIERWGGEVTGRRAYLASQGRSGQGVGSQRRW